MMGGGSMKKTMTVAAFCIAAALTHAHAAAPKAELAPAFPKLPEQGGPMAEKINHALAGLDRKFAAAAGECRAGDPAGNQADRSFEVTLKGAHYYAVVASENWYCGGAYPDTDTLALTYDLATGRPVDWVKLLPGLGLKGSTDTTFDGTVIGVVASKKLSDFYIAENAKSPDHMEDCAEALADPQLTFQLWPAAKEGGLAVEPASLPHATAACAEIVTVTPARLREWGAAPALVEDLEAR